MRSVFRSQFKITQGFGENKDYYKQFGLAGHEGIDLIPSGTVWDVLALEDGVVVLDDDTVGSVSADPYGKIVTLWHPTVKKASMYCHLSQNYVTQGQQVKRGDKIGTMGSTGNSTGAHLHLNLFNVDDNGVRLNRNNGYLGGIDPLPFLEEDTSPPIDNVSVPKTTFETLVKNSTLYDAFNNAGYTDVTVVLNALSEKEAIINSKNKDLQTCQLNLKTTQEMVEKMNDEDLSTSDQLLDVSHQLEEHKQGLNRIVEALGISSGSTPDQIASAVTELKKSKIKTAPKPQTLIDKLIFLFS